MFIYTATISKTLAPAGLIPSQLTSRSTWNFTLHDHVITPLINPITTTVFRPRITKEVQNGTPVRNLFFHITLPTFLQ